MPVASCGAVARSSLWPIALATPDGEAFAGTRFSALGRRKLYRETPVTCGSINYSDELLPAESCPASRVRRAVPFLTGQKGDGKSRRAGRAAADAPALRRGRESVARFATRPFATQRRPRRHTAKGPGKEPAQGEGESRQVVPLSFFSMSNRQSIGRRSQPGTEIGPWS
jgi:hypothetical protein